MLLLYVADGMFFKTVYNPLRNGGAEDVAREDKTITIDAGLTRGLTACPLPGYQPATVDAYVAHE